MFAFLQRQPTYAIGKILEIDLNIELLTDTNGKQPSKEVIDSLKETGYNCVIGTSCNQHVPNLILTETPIQVRTVRIYDIELELDEILSSDSLLTLRESCILIKADLDIPIFHLEDGIAQVRKKGYLPILSKTERYECLQDNYRNLKHIMQQGCLLEADMLSLTGYHGPDAKRLAEKLFREDLVNYAGTGIGNANEYGLINEVFQSKKLVKWLQSPTIKNKELLLQ